MRKRSGTTDESLGMDAVYASPAVMSSRTRQAGSKENHTPKEILNNDIRNIKAILKDQRRLRGGTAYVWSHYW